MAAISGSFESNARRPSRASGSSSTINVVGCIGSHAFRIRVAEGKFYGDSGPAVFAIFDFQPCLFAVELLQPGTGVGQADALIVARIARRKPRPIILHAKLDNAVDLCRADHNPARG